MCPVTQVGLGNACGACAAIHVVEHVWGGTFAPGQTDVAKVWSKVQLDSSQAKTLMKIGMGNGTESDPFKIADWLKTYHNIQCILYVKPKTDIASLLTVLWGGSPPATPRNGDGLDVSNLAKAKCAIGIYRASGGLHYLALHKPGKDYKYIDSNDKTPTWKSAIDVKAIDAKYSYAGGSIVVI